MPRRLYVVDRNPVLTLVLVLFTVLIGLMIGEGSIRLAFAFLFSSCRAMPSSTFISVDYLNR